MTTATTSTVEEMRAEYAAVRADAMTYRPQASTRDFDTAARSRLTGTDGAAWILAAESIAASWARFPMYPGDAPTAADAGGPEVPAGRYALALDQIRFFKVDAPATSGKWAGRQYITEQAGDALYPVRGARRAVILAGIAADPRAASIRYGIALGRCGCCGRTLTDPDSRAAGIGPICAAKAGW